MYVRIVSKRKGGTPPRDGELVVAVDRTNAVLGNKAVLKDHLDAAGRDAAIASFERERALDEEREGPMTREIRRLALLVQSGQAVALQCWCAPRRCHAELIRAQMGRILGRELAPRDEAGQGAPPVQDSLF
ncbi:MULTISPECIES: DUF4326 domain-containing protein [unclassified Variovorax]|uniref:DUF4326 domain-containing protein n=1 Tax=unclassified Variovorax TaxID=663243 RepID=UPI0013A57F30|nr:MULTISPECIES: DUF4326 domain-containing protein [unclassified Variovorax]